MPLPYVLLIKMKLTWRNIPLPSLHLLWITGLPQNWVRSLSRGRTQSKSSTSRAACRQYLHLKTMWRQQINGYTSGWTGEATRRLLRFNYHDLDTWGFSGHRWRKIRHLLCGNGTIKYQYKDDPSGWEQRQKHKQEEHWKLETVMIPLELKMTPHSRLETHLKKKKKLSCMSEPLSNKLIPDWDGTPPNIIMNGTFEQSHSTGCLSECWIFARVAAANATGKTTDCVHKRQNATLADIRPALAARTHTHVLVAVFPQHFSNSAGDERVVTNERKFENILIYQGKFVSKAVYTAQLPVTAHTHTHANIHP